MSDKKLPKKPGKAPAKNAASTGGKGGDNAPRERDQVDLFIEEVTEELQRERAYKLFRKYGPFVGGAVVLIVLAASVNEYIKSAATSAAREAGGVLIEAIDQPEQAGRIAAFDKAAKGQEGGPALVALLHKGALQSLEGESEAAAASFGAAATAAKAAERPLYADLASLRGLLARFDAMEPDEAIAALLPLAGAERPLRPLALELIGLAHGKAGRLEEAKAQLGEAEKAWGLALQGDIRQAVEAQNRIRLLIQGLDSGAGAPQASPKDK